MAFNKKVTKDKFIERAIKVHGNKYDYSKSDVNGVDYKVCIICLEHGEFWMTPYKHTTRKQGCPKCRNIGLTNEEWLEKAKKAHNNKYDYSKVKFKRIIDKVTIICPIHGEFVQDFRSHVNGAGCPKCKNVYQPTTEEFINKAIDIHGNRYDYSKVNYINNREKVTIICKEHGEFLQSPQKHLLGSGCHKCANNIKLTTEDWVKLAKEVHGDKYVYSKTEYKNNKTNLTITCPIHGDFEQLPYNHLNGYGCSKCSNKYKPTNDEFIEKAREIHGDKYDYSLVDYVNNHTKVKIICPIHGVFEQTPRNHIVKKNGCQLCNISKLEEEILLLLQNNKIDFEQQKTFDWLINKQPLTLDFYLPQYNIAIECQGEQHFIPITYFGGEEKLKYIQQNDLLKKQLCEEHGINLLYYSDLNIDYPYEVIEDKEKLLETIIKSQ